MQRLDASTCPVGVTMIRRRKARRKWEPRRLDAGSTPRHKARFLDARANNSKVYGVTFIDVPARLKQEGHSWQGGRPIFMLEVKIG